MIRPAPADHCCVIIVDGLAVRVLVGGLEPISDDARAALAELVRAAWQRLSGEPPAAADDPGLTSAPDQELNWPPPGVQPARARAKGSHPL